MHLQISHVTFTLHLDLILLTFGHYPMFGLWEVSEEKYFSMACFGSSIVFSILRYRNVCFVFISITLFIPTSIVLLIHQVGHLADCSFASRLSLNTACHDGPFHIRMPFVPFFNFLLVVGHLWIQTLISYLCRVGFMILWFCCFKHVPYFYNVCINLSWNLRCTKLRSF